MRPGHHLSTLSSGEIHILIIFASIIFRPNISKEQTIILIDEPELSLHVRWQEKFMDSLLEASDEFQYIIATHSPEIIIGRVDHCVELRGKNENKKK